MLETIEQTPPLLIKDLGMLFPAETSKRKKHYGIYKCSCGNEFKATISDIKIKTTKSCGCYKKSSLWNVKHGLYYHKLYNTWNLIIQRTTNPKHNAFKEYGDKGIFVCKEWENVENFIQWAESNGWENGLTIDRINGLKGYEPSNCRWATKAVQARNTVKIRSSNKSGYRGVSWVKSKNKFVASIGVNGVSKTIGAFNEAIDAAKAYDAFVIANNLEHTRNFDIIS